MEGNIETRIERRFPGRVRIVRIALLIAALLLLALGLASGELDLTRIESGTL